MIKNSIKNKVTRTPTISETIYLYLKNAILTGELRSKQKIVEKEVASLFDVSQTPVREAIRRLSGEKLLIITARKDIIVAGASWGEVQELYQVVGFLDYPAVIKAMERLSPADFNHLRKVTRDLKRSFDIRKSDQYLDSTLDIHERIWRACGNKILCETLIQLMEKVRFLGSQGFSPYPEMAAMERSYEDHCQLIEAMERKDLHELKRIIERHWHMPY
jgi:DNA-binding GntR family transcriptional regulator